MWLIRRNDRTRSGTTTARLPAISLLLHEQCTTPLQNILAAYRATSQTEREKGTYFEELIRTYIRYEPCYADLYSNVWLYADWAKEIDNPQSGFAKRKDPETGKSVNDKTTVTYNGFITLKNIPLAAYDYIVNGKPALEWVMERQSVTTDKDSGITNDANH